MKKHFTNEQIIYTLRQAEAGTPVVEICRKLGVTEQPSTAGRRSLLVWEYLSWLG